MGPRWDRLNYTSPRGQLGLGVVQPGSASLLALVSWTRGGMVVGSQVGQRQPGDHVRLGQLGLAGQADMNTARLSRPSTRVATLQTKGEQ